MNPKTKAKIEAMADQYDGTPASYEGAELRVYKAGVNNGATPWAEWCERFEKLSVDFAYVIDEGVEKPALDISNRAAGAFCRKYFKEFQSLRKEYREFLEDVEL